MTVIRFPVPERPWLAAAEQHELDDALEAAFDVHRMIMNCLQMDSLRENPGAVSSVLLFAVSQHFGLELAI